MHILVLSLLLLGCCLCDMIPDLYHRETPAQSEAPLEHSEYNHIVFPTHPGNESEIAETRSILDSLCDIVVETRDATGLQDWRVFVKAPHKKRQLRRHRGIAKLERVNKSPRHESVIERRDDTPLDWIVFPTDGTDKNETLATEEWLKANAVNKTRPISHVNDPNGNIAMWGMVTLDDAGVEEAKKQPGIRALEKDRLVAFAGMIPRRSSYLQNHQNKPRGIKKRASIEWDKEKKPPAPWELVLHSEYEGQKSDDSGDIEDFVFEKNAGADSWVYVLDWGINLKVKDDQGNPVFSNYDESLTLHAEASRTAGDDPNTDDHPDSHGTRVASKVGGSFMGTANQVSIISVKAGKTLYGMEQGWALILEDIRNNPERAKKSVIVSAIHHPDPMTVEDALSSDVGKPIHDTLVQIVNAGVPIVLAAGNEAKNSDRKDIDMLPMLFAGPDLPLIIVGAVNDKREVADFSQGGPLLTTLAGGVDIEVMNKVDGDEDAAEGTSLAAPQVAGTLAQYLNHDTTPWSKDTMDIKRVNDIKAYVQSSASSWKHDTGVTIFWNGADKAAHDSVGADICSRDEAGCSSTLSCTNVKFDANNAYLSRWILTDAIDNQYCPKLEGMSSGIGAGTYLENTPETFEISATGNVDSSGNVPSVDDCKKHLHEIYDGCDIRHDDFNPMDWTAGGEVKADGWTYTIRPVHERPPALNKPKGWCQIDTCHKGGCTARMWGANWESSDFGSALRQALDDFSKDAVGSGVIGDAKGYDTSAWSDNFHYELLDDHEWTVTIPVNLGYFLQYGKSTAIVMRGVVPDLEVDDCVEYP